MVEIEVVDPIEIVLPDVVPDIPSYHNGNEYILDLNKLKTQEDILKVLKHFSTRVVLDVLEIESIEQYVRPVDNKQIH